MSTVAPEITVGDVPRASGKGSAVPGLVLLAWLAIALVAATRALSFPSYWPIAIGSATCCLVTLPALRKDYSPYGPWTAVMAITYVAGGLRPLYVRFGEEGTRSFDVLFLLGRDWAFFAHNGAIYLLGFALFVLGYMWARPERRMENSPLRAFSKPVLGPSTPLVIILCALIGTFGLVSYIQATGGLDLSDFSGKQASGGTEMSQDYESHGIQRSLTQFCVVAFWLHVAYVLRPGHKFPLLSFEVVGGVFLFLLSCIFPIVTSSRSDIVYTIFVTLAIAAMLRRPFRLWALVLVGVVTIASINFITLARGSSSSEVSVSSVLALDAVEESIIYNRNFADLYNASHIIGNTPEVLPAANGRTITGWLAAPIPRAVWPTKPIVNPGPIVGEYIYGNGRSGVPPGVVAEMWWNWQWPGIVVGTVLAGILVGLISRLKNIDYRNTAWVVLFCCGLLRFGAFTLTSGVGGAAFKSLEAFVCILFAVTLCSVWPDSADES
ncbi:oligosaccharide repeat unit polymerase [Kytococcus sedentarius]|uniref:Oligosaccharide repeat unit polymerase n=1 Tax=Kytococcus sedentarius (strain ATCC 14392 / DSM 20547 / JCM 11482 / CCUG 33030 / NBRC 15357 / NCTC 11040 / CCM 314 / 541) TaxID=478801 RepID=C7NJU3_KYTSD|nr:O-antigen polymerase [Kytococcus sedentarius]ACV06875.1 hypothetical protein Ksed_18730 [Kytococcus sedentarius DSM 20547]QQB62891.1 oligosaccharide repeat unit polymerase [Kytococcus sedentarius]STX14300.1 Uncharacterised protein [Kytococcus sedentarius]